MIIDPHVVERGDIVIRGWAQGIDGEARIDLQHAILPAFAKMMQDAKDGLVQALTQAEAEYLASIETVSDYDLRPCC